MKKVKEERTNKRAKGICWRLERNDKKQKKINVEKKVENWLERRGEETDKEGR